MRVKGLIWCISLISSQLMASDTLALQKSIRNFFPDLTHNLCRQATAPFQSTTHLLVFTGFSALVLAAIPADASVNNFVHTRFPSSGFVHETSLQVSRMGGVYAYAGLGATVAAALACGNKKLTNTCVLSAQSALSAALWTRLLKYACGRERPFLSGNIPGSAGKWNGPVSLNRFFSSPGNYDAFPSGHACTAFSIASVFAMAYNDKTWVPPLCYGLATLAAASRVSNARHWLSDVLAGSLLGYACARQVYYRAFPRPAKKKNAARALQFHFSLYLPV